MNQYTITIIILNLTPQGGLHMHNAFMNLIPRLILLALLFIATAICQQSTVLINDDFNDGIVDNTKWIVTNTLTRSADGPAGNNVIEENGMIKLFQNSTDFGGAIRTKPLKVNKRGKIIIKARFISHYSNDKSSGEAVFYLTDINGSGPLKDLFKWSHSHYVFGSKIRLGFGPYYYGGFLPMRFDQWVEETISYDPETGELNYWYDNYEGKTQYFLPILQNDYFFLYFDSYGWWTGHYIFYDWIKVEQLPPETEPNQTPVADAGPDIEINSQNLNQLIITGNAFDADATDVIQYRWLEGECVLKEWQSVPSDGSCSLEVISCNLPIGQHALTLEVSDGKSAFSDNMTLIIYNSAPTVSASGSGVYQVGTKINLSGAVSDYDGDDILYDWLLNEEVIYSGIIKAAIGGKPVSLPFYSMDNLDAGDYIFTLKVSDGFNDVVTNSITISIIDTEAPTLAPESNLKILWPPNHEMKSIIIQPKANDNSGSVLISATISSNEQQNELGEGDIGPDWTIPEIDQLSGNITFQLRSERAGNGYGRTYSISINACDCSGNCSNAMMTIQVPHNNSKK